jgi:hypothetical protein
MRLYTFRLYSNFRSAIIAVTSCSAFVISFAFAAVCLLNSYLLDVFVSLCTCYILRFLTVNSKVPLHAMVAHGGRGGTAPTHT